MKPVFSSWWTSPSCTVKQSPLLTSTDVCHATTSSVLGAPVVFFLILDYLVNLADGPVVMGSNTTVRFSSATYRPMWSSPVTFTSRIPTAGSIRAVFTSSQKLLTFGWAFIERSIEHVHPLLMCFSVLLPESSSAGMHQFEGKGQTFGFVETGMNRGSHQNNENLTLYEGLPFRASPRHGRQGFYE